MSGAKRQFERLQKKFLANQEFYKNTPERHDPRQVRREKLRTKLYTRDKLGTIYASS